MHNRQSSLLLLLQGNPGQALLAVKVPQRPEALRNLVSRLTAYASHNPSERDWRVFAYCKNCKSCKITLSLILHNRHTSCVVATTACLRTIFDLTAHFSCTLKNPQYPVNQHWLQRSTASSFPCTPFIWRVHIMLLLWNQNPLRQKYHLCSNM